MKVNNSVGKGDEGSLKKVKVIVVGDSLLNGINKKGLCKKHDVKVKNVPGGTTVLDKIDRLVGQKPDCIIVYGGTKNITKGINTLNTVKKTERKVKNSLPNTRLAFSSYCEMAKNTSQINYLMLMVGRIIAPRTNSIEPMTKTPQKITFERSYTYHVCKQFIEVFAIMLLKFI